MQDLGGLELALERARVRRCLPEPARRKALRLAAGLSQDALGAVLGVSRVSVARYELGERSPRGEVAACYAAVLERLALEVATG